MEFPWNSIRRIEPWFFGTRLTLDPAVHHLGNEVREGFHVPVPETKPLSGEFTWDSNTSKRVFFSAAVTNLEPSHPETPPASPFLHDLREGFLRTELIINDKPVGDLNRQTKYRMASDRPQSIRLPIPTSILKNGSNEYRLKQHSSRSDPHDFDDFEIWQISIDVRN